MVKSVFVVHLVMHSLVDSVCALTRGRTHDLAEYWDDALTH